ncbi:hypothetical protein EHV15_27410 [Paenibacillus oralis]|uniref:Uncharacterized protein n=1 Tax=Paenibacillus oralis TaxID=2490856 RepID=A0A3P3U9I8_9BACL|nr:hypothetical protein [Paenibacillus oralis]RRJ66229.1 hypothetical protein EHV15_27410 [Paenibacillus oralis]
MNHPSLLSGIVKEFIRQCPRRETVRNRIEVAQTLRQNGIPVFEALLDFQEKYGGMFYEFGGLKDQSFVLDAMGPSLYGGGLPKVMKYGDEEVVECLYFRDIYWGRSCYMDRYGALYVLLVNGELMFFENRAETFIENQAILYGLLGKQKQWVTSTVYESQVSAWISNAAPAPILLTPSHQEASQWWKSPDERLYVHIQRVKGKDVTGTAYAAEADDLSQLTSRDVYSAQGFPFHCYYYPEKKLLYTGDIRQQYYFNRKLYNTGDYAKVTIAHVRDTKEMRLYLTGQKNYPVERPIEDFLLKLPALELPAGDYDDTLIGYAREQGDEMILKLISHIADMEYRDLPGRSAAEQMVDGLLYREFLRRMALFADSYSISAHPLYFNAQKLVERPDEYEQVEEDYAVLRRMRGASPSFISRMALFYMKRAREGNEAARRAYRVYEPLLLMYGIGGYILKEHGFIEVGGGAFHQGSWRNHIGKEPIEDLYRRIEQAWKHRNREYALEEIRRIKWDQKTARTGRLSAENNVENSEMLRARFNRLELRLGLSPDDVEESDDPAWEGERLMPALLKARLKLRKFSGTVAPLICEKYVRWSMLLDRQHPVSLQNPCLYEPFLELLREQDNIEEWDKRAAVLLQLFEREPMVNYADYLRSKHQS